MGAEGKKDREMLKDNIYKEDSMQDVLKFCLEKINSHREVIIFGAGLGGEKTQEFMKVHGAEGRIKCYLDNNPRKWGTLFSHVPVHKPDDILKQYKGELLMIACGEGDAIKEQLKAYGIPEENIIIPDIGVMNFEQNDYQFIWKYMDMLELVYQMLGDEKSRRVFTNLLNYRISHDTDLLEEIYDAGEEQYFDSELIDRRKKSSFLDCGSYIGDTLEAYLEIFKGGVQKNMVCGGRERELQLVREKDKRITFGKCSQCEQGNLELQGNTVF